MTDKTEAVHWLQLAEQHKGRADDCGALARAVLAARPAAPQAMDERAAFEAWATDQWYSIAIEDDGKTYRDPRTHCGWHAWHARAALSQSAPEAQAAPAQPHSVDWLGRALDLESAAKGVESQTVERAMLAGAQALRLMGAQAQPARGCATCAHRTKAGTLACLRCTAAGCYSQWTPVAQAQPAPLPDLYLSPHTIGRTAGRTVVAELATGRIVGVLSEQAQPAQQPDPLHPNHRSDLRYVLTVLEKVATQPGTWRLTGMGRSDVEAAVTGMRYIIKRTEEAAQQPDPRDEALRLRNLCSFYESVLIGRGQDPAAMLERAARCEPAWDESKGKP